MLFLLGLLACAVTIYAVNWLLLSSPDTSVVDPRAGFVSRFQEWLRLIIAFLVLALVVTFLWDKFDSVQNR